MGRGHHQHDRKEEADSAGLSERVVIGGLLVLISVVLLPVLGFGFVYDDGWTFTANGFLRQPQDLPLLLTDEAARRHVPDAFRPTLVLFDVLSYQLFGLFAPALHAISLGLHLLVCWLAARWLSLLGAPLPLRATTVALFGLLAIHAEAIAVISFHEDLLAAALGLGALLAASSALRSDSSRTTLGLSLAAMLLLALACGAKMSVATLPILFWLAEHQNPWRKPSTVTTQSSSQSSGQLSAHFLSQSAEHPPAQSSSQFSAQASIQLQNQPTEQPSTQSLIQRHTAQRPVSTLENSRFFVVTLLLAAGVALALGHTFATHGSLSPYAGEANLRLFSSRVGIMPVLAKSLQIHLGYLQQIFAPWGLSPEYVDSGASWLDPATLLAAAGFASLLLYGLWAAFRRRRPLIALIILGTAVLALPTSNLAAMPNMRADRLMYLPSLPLCLGMAAAALALGRRLRRWSPLSQHFGPSLLFAPVTALAILQGAVLQATTQVYRSSGTLWSVAIRRAPGSARAQAIFGELLLANRDPVERDTPAELRRFINVRSHCRRALKLDPLDEISHLCTARLAIAQEQWNQAEHSLRRALELSVDRNHRILAALAEITLDLPDKTEDLRREESLALLAQAIREYPYAVEVWSAAGRILHRIGEPIRARLALQQAFSLGPERPQTSLWAIEAALDRGDRQLAKQLFAERARYLQNADPGHLAALERRLWDHAQLFPTAKILVESEPRTRESLLHDP